MPSFQDSAFIILLGLLLFGPKGLAKMARQLGKLVGEFRRASAEFRMQMEDELRMDEQAEQQRKIEAMQAAAPPTPRISDDIPEPDHPHMPAPVPAQLPAPAPAPVPALPAESAVEAAREQPVAPLPIASSGDLNLMPPATGLPMGRGGAGHVTSASSAFDTIPKTADPALPHGAHPVTEEEPASHA